MLPSPIFDLKGVITLITSRHKLVLQRTSQDNQNHLKCTVYLNDKPQHTSVTSVFPYVSKLTAHVPSSNISSIFAL